MLPITGQTLEEAAAHFITAEVPNVEAVLKAAPRFNGVQTCARVRVRVRMLVRVRVRVQVCVCVCVREREFLLLSCAHAWLGGPSSCSEFGFTKGCELFVGGFALQPFEAARDILAEQFAHRGDVRQLARSMLESKATVVSNEGSADNWKVSTPQQLLFLEVSCVRKIFPEPGA